MQWKVKPLTVFKRGAGEMARWLRERTVLAVGSQHPNDRLQLLRLEFQGQHPLLTSVGSCTCVVHLRTFSHTYTQKQTTKILWAKWLESVLCWHYSRGSQLGVNSPGRQQPAQVGLSSRPACPTEGVPGCKMFWWPNKEVGFMKR